MAIAPVDVAFAAKSPVMRVLVFQGKETKIRSDGNKPLFVRGIKSSEQKLRAITFREDNGLLNVKLDTYETFGEWRSLSKYSKIRIRSKDPRGIWLGNRRYAGELRITFDVNGLQIVNYLELEKYLVSVVGSEMPKSWPNAALEAQAIAARTYALKKQKKSNNYDVKSTSASQVYLGIESETASTTSAVKNTRSLVLAYQGKLINAVFHSSSGGFTEASGYVWSKQLPYLVSVSDSDHHSPKHRWDMQFSPNQLREGFPEIGGVKTIQLLGLSPTGRILKAKVSGPRGDFFLTGKALRSRLGLKSTLVRFKMIDPKIITKKNINYFSSSSSPLKLESKPPSLSNRRSIGFWRDWSKGGESIVDERIPILTSPPRIVSDFDKSFEVDLDIKPLPPLPSTYRNVVLLARGFGAGHGVGMSQWGANGMAKKGANFRQILSHYYKGVTIRRFQSL